MIKPKDRYKILSLDGGGTWSLYQALILQDLYGKQTKGHAVLKQFDLVAANSGGSIVLGGLIENYSLEEIVNIFLCENILRKMFSKLTFSEIILHPINYTAFFRYISGVGPQYSTSKKKIVLDQVFPNTHQLFLNQIPQYVQHPSLNILIVGFKYYKNRVKFFRSDEHSVCELGQYAPTTMAEAIHASTNAPVNYFNIPATLRFKDQPGIHYYWDGALSGFNNPILAAITEAMHHIDISQHSVDVLSIGTISKKIPVLDKQQIKDSHHPPQTLYHAKTGRFNFFDDVKKVSKSVLTEPLESANYIAHTILKSISQPNRNHKLVRLCPVLSPLYSYQTQSYSLPKGLTHEEFERLNQLDIDVVKKNDLDILSKFFELYLQGTDVKNQAIRFKQDPNLATEQYIGQLYYAEGKKAWLDT